MGEKIAFAAWNYISLLCSEHKTALELTVSGLKPVYRCPADGCKLCFSVSVYEKVLDDVVKKQNDGNLIIGEKWKRKAAGTTYVFTVEACPTGKSVEVSVTQI